jgi:AhpD family alkylhydroperoxidase
MSRLDPWTAAPRPLKALVDYAMAAQADGLEASLQHLVLTRASQINGCAVCLNMHIAEALKHGETIERLYMLDAWHEAGIYTPREIAALAWTEALTRLSETKAPDADYDAVMAQFTPEEAVKLTLLIGTINTFNKIGVGFRRPPLGLKPLAHAA